uniref:Late endosomal/lysosomal adaptor and MAPK and MTOR activator 4 n=1 Tax=Capitella teleta TaxID=283909 RepID=X1Z4D0_CAPTE
FTTMTTQSIERIPDSLGYLILNEDGAVLGSGGDLVNDEQTADRIINLVRSAVKLSCTSSMHDRHMANFKKMSVLWEDFLYAIAISNHKVYVSKRHNIPSEPITA